MAILAGCSGDGSAGAVVVSGNAALFDGYWGGAFSLTAPGAAGAAGDAGRAAVTFTKTTGANSVMSGLCAGGKQVPVQASSDTDLSFAPATCAVQLPNCAAGVLDIQQGRGTRQGETIAFVLNGVETGCGLNVPFTFAFQGTRGSPDAPSPFIAPSRASGSVGDTITLDGSLSFDPHGHPLTYQWSLQAPDGSIAQLSTQSGTQPKFPVDLPGAYLVSLAVVSDDHRQSPTAQVSLQGFASNVTPLGPPLAGIAAPRRASAGTPIAFDFIGHSNSGSESLIYSWKLIARPPGSAAALSGDPTAATETLIADALGDYTVQLTISDLGLTAQATATVTTLPQVDRALAFQPIDVRYSRTLDELLIISGRSLHIVDPATQADTAAVALSADPTCLSLSSDGRFAAVGHDSLVTFVDLTTLAVTSFPTTAPAGSIVLGDPVVVNGHPTRFAYIFTSRDQFQPIHNVDLSTGAETLTASVYSGMHALLQPAGARIFGGTSHAISPANIVRFDLDGTAQTASEEGETQLGDNTEVGDPLAFSADGALLLTAVGTRFRTSDLTHAGTVSGVGPQAGTPFLFAADFSADGVHWLVQSAPFGPDTAHLQGDTGFNILDANLASVQQVPYPVFTGGVSLHGRYIFSGATGAKQIAVAQIEGTSSYTVVRFQDGQPVLE